MLPDAWPWERWQAQNRLTGMLPDAWPWERRQAQSRLSSMLPDAWPWQRAQAQKRLSVAWRQRPELRMPDIAAGPWRRRRPRVAIWQLLTAAALGGAVAYFLDPEMGNRRRKMALQRTAHLVRRSARGLGKSGTKLGGDITGKRQALMHSRDAHEPFDDATLAHKVESVLFRDPHIAKGRININAEHGVVVLRGEVEQPSDMRDIERAVKDIDGVHEVRSLLHLANSTTQMS